MHTPALKERLARYLQTHPGVWVHKHDLAKKGESVGYMQETVGRRLRELAEEGILEVKEENGSVWYRAPIKQPEQMTLV